MRRRLLRGWLGQVAVGLTVAIALTAVLALAIAHGGAPGRPASAPSAQSTVAPAAVVPTDTPGPSTSASPAPTPTPQPPTPAATPSPATPTPATTVAAWQPRQLPSSIGPLMGLTCVDASHCWAVGEDPTGFAPAIAATADGGVTWTVERVPQRPASLQAVFDVSCFSTLRCVAAAATSGGETTSVALTTANGGATWTQRSLPTDGQNGPTRLACVGGSTCSLYGADQPRGANVLDFSTDAGATWTATTAPDAVCTLAQSCRVSGMTFVNAKDGWLAANTCPNPGACTGLIAATSDGGATWRTVDTGDGYINDIWCGPAASSVDCIALGAKALVSHDAGGTWAPRSVPNGLASISCSDPLHCTAAGSRSQAWDQAGLIPQQGVLATTGNGGDSWTTQLLPADTSTWLNRVSCVSASACMLAGGQQAKVAYAGGPPGTGPQSSALVMTSAGWHNAG